MAASLIATVTACRFVPQGGMAERCADIMQRAYPGADIDIRKSEAAAVSLTTIIAHVEAERTNLPANARIASRLAVECTFENNVLTGFKWTAGP
jgi:hypothetical protein